MAWIRVDFEKYRGLLDSVSLPAHSPISRSLSAIIGEIQDPPRAWKSTTEATQLHRNAARPRRSQIQRRKEDVTHRTPHSDSSIHSSSPRQPSTKGCSLTRDLTNRHRIVNTARRGSAIDGAMYYTSTSRVVEGEGRTACNSECEVDCESRHPLLGAQKP